MPTEPRARRAAELRRAEVSLERVVTEIARGYATTSAFVQAFRREMGVAPGSFGRGTARG